MVMTGAMAAELDRVGLEGSGTPPEPLGILGTSNIGTVTSVGTIADYSDIITGLGTLLTANFPLEAVNRYAVMHPATWTRYQNLATGISSDKSPLARPEAISRMQFLTTTNLSKTGTSPNSYNLYLGDFSNITLGTRMESSIEVLKVDSYVGNLVIDLVGYLRADWIVTRPSAFCVLEGITP